MRLYIAEKPALAKAIFEGHGGSSDVTMRHGYFQIGDVKITACFGHMLELFDPEDYDEKYKKWTLEDLPIPTVYPPTLKPIESSKQRLELIMSLIEEADDIVHAGDPDEEGQLLIDEILNYVGNTKPVYRVLIADLNLAPVQKALSELRPNSEFEALGRSALARSIGDQLFGYNLTRAFTLQGRKQGFDGLLSVGRVQSAVLGLINSRTLANQTHVGTFYYDITANVQVGSHVVKAKYQTKDSDLVDEKKRLISESHAQFIAEHVRNKPTRVTLALTKPERSKPPLPLNLSTLQQLCSKRFGYSASQTLDIMQGLYEQHKLLTYPRTDNRYLSDEHYYQAGDIARAIVGTLPEFESAVPSMDTSLKHKAFNAEKIEAHHAIVPTTKSGQHITLTDAEQKVYRLVAQHFIGLFYGDAVRNKTKVTFDFEGDQFNATQSVLVERGWEVLHKGDKGDAEDNAPEFDLSSLAFNDSGMGVSSSVDKKKTSPPKYFTEASLLAAMTRAAKFIDDPTLRAQLEAKDEGSSDQGSIGTEATRASILEKLAQNTDLVSIEKEKGYGDEWVWKTTKQGQDFCAALPKTVTAPDISALWCGEQVNIKQGELDVHGFVQNVEAYVADIIGEVKTKGIAITPNMPVCPACKKAYLRRTTNLKDGSRFYTCSRYPECKTAYPEKNGRPVMTPQKKLVVSKHPCPVCQKGLIRRSKRTPRGTMRYYWTCSGFPECKTSLLDTAGKPNYATAKTLPSDTDNPTA
ncbi:topoisomerase DNA-binding C4 zinc finger domain-containing protein [Vibrio parahaemolyticus]|nr:topoisomerase DNA-binding C4 zinc finger domain-containing protein [Vibrio parahaemolyticus]ELZ7200649.1 topoisomerase DNA-binding C4 zinc finger domain-containing protein [Vibrio parahaemolyticus]HBC3530166.1 topoisomerase DNA-binding C4 zinc finger domain-containing protein [Vibrio parahaemolyticus]